MKQSYIDITNKLGEPLWWDEEGVPRYCKFKPAWVNNIYADEIILARITCQQCRHNYVVAVTNEKRRKGFSLKDGIPHYGDPLNYCDCSGGATMNSIMREVVEFWERNKNYELKRDRKYEKEINK